MTSRTDLTILRHASGTATANVDPVCAIATTPEWLAVAQRTTLCVKLPDDLNVEGRYGEVAATMCQAKREVPSCLKVSNATHVGWTAIFYDQ